MQLPGWRDPLPDWSVLPWKTTKSPGVWWLPVHLDSDDARPDPDGRTPGATVLIRMDPGHGYAPHRHVGFELVLVLAGGYVDGDGEHRAGALIHYPAQSEHAPRALGDPSSPVGPDNPPCILLSVVPEGIELLRPS